MDPLTRTSANDGLLWVSVAKFLRYLAYLLWGGLILTTAWLLLVFVGMALSGDLLLPAIVGLTITGWALLRAAILMFMRQPVFEPAVLLTPQATPSLFRLVGEVARLVGASPPDYLLLSLSGSFHVYEGTAVLPTGRRITGRVLVLSAPLLRLMKQAEVAAILAHEFAHFTGRDTDYTRQVAPIHLSFRVALQGLWQNLTAPLRSLYGALLRIFYVPPILIVGLFYLLFQILDRRVSRARELRADRIAASAHGAGALTGGLIKAVGFGALLDEASIQLFYRLVWKQGAEPNFPRFFAQGASVAGDRAEQAVSAAFHQRTTALDTHPALLDRLGALGVSPFQLGKHLIPVPGDDTDLDKAEEILTRQIGMRLLGEIPVDEPLLEGTLHAEQPVTSRVSARSMLPWILAGSLVATLLLAFWAWSRPTRQVSEPIATTPTPTAVSPRASSPTPSPPAVPVEDILPVRLGVLHGKMDPNVGRVEHVDYQLSDPADGSKRIIFGFLRSTQQYATWKEAQQNDTDAVRQWIQQVHSTVRTHFPTLEADVVFAWVVEGVDKPQGFTEDELTHLSNGRWQGVRILAASTYESGKFLAELAPLPDEPVAQSESSMSSEVSPTSAQPPVPSDTGYVTYGSTQSEVRDLLGTPLESTNFAWHYGSDVIQFDYRGLVTGWENRSGRLKVSMGDHVPGAPPITWEATREQVAAAMGTPQEATSFAWYYGDDTVTFDYRGLVTGWENRSGRLKLFLGDPVPSAPAFTVGSTRAEVVAAMGTPQEATSFAWYYGGDTVTFDYRGLVSGWENKAGRLKVR